MCAVHDRITGSGGSVPGNLEMGVKKVGNREVGIREVTIYCS